jgi:hypothetical protein
LVCIIPISFISINSTKWSTVSLTFVSFDITFFERQCKKFNHERLLEMEIIALSSELASFILSDIGKKRSILHCTVPEVQGMLDYCNVNGPVIYVHWCFILRDQDLDKYIWTVTVTLVMFNVNGPVIYVANIKRNSFPPKKQ